jgi:hypothetical protein
MPPQIRCYAIIVEQGIVNIKEEYDLHGWVKGEEGKGRKHGALPHNSVL